MDDMTVISVNQPSPFESAGVGQFALAIAIAHGIPTAIVQLPGVTDADIASIKAPVLALALLQDVHNPIGIMAVALGQSQDDVWPLCAPVLGEDTVLREWATHPAEGNIMLITLVDSNTNIVKALRTIGLPFGLLEMLRQGILSTPHIDLDAMLIAASTPEFAQIWKDGAKWVGDLDSEQYRRLPD